MLEKLLNKYDYYTPRYTSYPPVPFWDKEFLSLHEWIESVDRGVKNSDVSVYIHVPFCKKLCSFCACNKIVTNKEGVAKRYLRFLEQEILLYTNRFGKINACNLHIGGGTPTYLAVDEICSLMDFVKKNISFAEDPEVSVEVDPRTVTKEKLQAFFDNGFNRISFGVQDFDYKVQEAINRIQSFEMVQEKVEMAREIGFCDVNFDLIYGLPYQTSESVEQTFLQVCKLKPNRIAFYGYAHMPNNFKEQLHVNKFEIPKGQDRQALNIAGRKILIENGYEEIGMDHFALEGDDMLLALKTGKLTRNFMGYTRNFSSTLIGFGYSAISKTDDYFAQNVKDLEEYEKLIISENLPLLKMHKITDEQRIVGKQIIDLMTTFVAPISDLQVSVKSLEIKNMIEDGLILLENGKIFVTKTGLPFLRNIATLFDCLFNK